MACDTVTAGGKTFTILTEQNAPNREHFEVTLSGVRPVLWGERFEDRLWLWSASGKQVLRHTLGTPLAPCAATNPIIEAAVEAVLSVIGETAPIAAAA